MSFRDKNLIAMLKALNEIADKGEFPAVYLGAAWKYYSGEERGWGEPLSMAKDMFPRQINLINHCRPGSKGQLRVRVSGNLLY